MTKIFKIQTLQLKRSKHSWIKPEGYNTGIEIYNCITKSKQPLIVKNKNLVTWYTCGPTVYSSAHLGHASCYVKLDVIQRILKNHFKLNLVTIMNITDIDDKIIKRSIENKIEPHELVKHYEKEFWADLQLLQIPKPNLIVRVTDNIKVITQFIDKLVRNGHAYQADDNSVYFDVKKYENYGKLQNIGELNLDKEGPKRSASDFALWKSQKEGEPAWASPWGSGRPGWHIECSALASHLLGPNIDFHAGGLDLRFPHHENEEAQSCCYHSTNQWVNYWIHTGYLHLKGSEKMSKSVGNLVTIQEFIKDNSEDFRMACVMSHYRSGMEFSNEVMHTAQNLLNNYKNFIDNCKNYVNGNFHFNLNGELIRTLLTESREKIDNDLLDDFNTPAVINTLNHIVTTFNIMQNSASTDVNSYDPILIVALSNLVNDTLNLFGINLSESVSRRTSTDYVEILDVLNEFRQEMRQLGLDNRDKGILKSCDQVRRTLRKYGIIIKDHGKISSWSS